MGGVGLEEFCCTSLRTAVEFARPCSHGRREMFRSGQRVKHEEERVVKREEVKSERSNEYVKGDMGGGCWYVEMRVGSSQFPQLCLSSFLAAMPLW